MSRASNVEKPCSAEFGREAVGLCRRSGKLLRTVVVGVGVSTETLRIWVGQSEFDEGKRLGLSSEGRGELGVLRRVVAGVRPANAPLPYECARQLGFLDELPLTTTGKIRRGELRRHADGH